jgi:NADH:ubiquinone oxidoreductase subunit 5 (subunit L)/multisubunit Na+/H+ antiporter MnhA subunit
VKGALFICAGIVLNETESVDERDLASRPVGSPFTIAVYVAGALGLGGSTTVLYRAWQVIY